MACMVDAFNCSARLSATCVVLAFPKLNNLLIPAVLVLKALPKVLYN